MHIHRSIMFSPFPWILLLAPLCWGRWCWQWTQVCSECDETLFLPVGTSEIIIKRCPAECYCCSAHAEIVSWRDKHGNKGEVTEHNGKYMMSVGNYPDVTEPGQHNITILYTLYCENSETYLRMFSTQKTLNVYDANVNMHKADAEDHSHFVCSTGMAGDANGGISMQVNFSTPSGDIECSVQCGSTYQQQPPCDWNNVTWNESTGTCTVTIDKPTPIDTGLYCCSVAIDSSVTRCGNMSFSEPTHTSTPTDNYYNKTTILIGSGVGIGVLLLILSIVIVSSMIYTWHRRRGYIPLHDGRPECGGR